MATVFDAVAWSYRVSMSITENIPQLTQLSLSFNHAGDSPLHLAASNHHTTILFSELRECESFCKKYCEKPEFLGLKVRTQLNHI